MNQKRNVTLIGIVALVAISLIAGVSLYNKMKPSEVVMDLYEYYGVTKADDADSAVLVLQDTIMEEDVMLIGAEKYINYTVVRDYFNDKFYWDAYENVLIFTTPTEVIKTNINSTDYYINKEKQTMTTPIVKTDGDIVYVSLSFIEKYANIEYEYYEAPNRLVVKCKWGQEYQCVTVKKDTEIRYEADKHSDIVKSVSEGNKLIVLEDLASSDASYNKVVTEDGIIGYALNKKLSAKTTEKLSNDYQEPVYANINKGYVSMGWYSVVNQSANSNLESTIKNTQGLTVISPTWFSVSESDGSISSIASTDFVTTAHNKGIDVWILVDDFNPDVSVAEVLSHTSTRENLINELIAETLKYNADGINIDFEYVTEQSSRDYLQFIRELSIKCRANNLVLSVDSYVCMSYNSFYYRGKVSEVVDYVVIMGYDEHHKNSEESGSTASITWTKKAIENSLADGVNGAKLIVGIPFYARLFEEQNGAIISCTSMSMSEQTKYAADNNITPTWDEETQQNYIEHSTSTSTFKLWMEDATSIEAKLKVINEVKIGGMAYWRLGYETNDIWNVIIKYVN